MRANKLNLHSKLQKITTAENFKSQKKPNQEEYNYNMFFDEDLEILKKNHNELRISTKKQGVLTQRKVKSGMSIRSEEEVSQIKAE